MGPYDPVILKLLKYNMNLQFVTGICAMLTYLTSHLHKPEHAVSILRKKASKESYRNDIKSKMLCIGNILTKRKVPTYEAIEGVLS